MNKSMKLILLGTLLTTSTVSFARGGKSISKASYCDYNTVRDEVASVIKTYARPGYRSCGGKVYHPLRAAVYPVENGKVQGETPILDIRSKDQERIASSQKIVTAYLLYKNRSMIKYPVTMSKGARKIGAGGEPSSVWSRVSNTAHNEQSLFQAILNLSSNGASFRAMEIVTGSSYESAHAKYINKFIDQIVPGNSTSFTNAHGLDRGWRIGGRQNNFSNGRDMAKITAIIYSDKAYRNFLAKNRIGTSKVGATCLAGKNNVIYIKKAQGNCKGQTFSVFYSGVSHDGATSAIYNYFNNSL